MGYVQIIELQTTRFEEVEALHEAWLADTVGTRTTTSETILADRDHPGRRRPRRVSGDPGGPARRDGICAPQHLIVPAMNDKRAARRAALLRFGPTVRLRGSARPRRTTGAASVETGSRPSHSRG